MTRHRSLQDVVLRWFDQHRRVLPWRDVDDPYAVLVSELMLQQTQVARVVPAYRRFLARFPDVRSLAAAPVADVVRAWSGLGYNRRAVNLHRAAQAIVEHHDGQVPREVAALHALPGVGGYTARAVAAFAFGDAVAPVDTNIARVLTRAVAGAPVRGARLQALADSLVPPERARDWSAALMDVGAAHCTTRPRCDSCPLRAHCAWAAAGGDDPHPQRRSASRFAGSDRYHRGRLLDRLRHGAVASHDLAGAARVGDDDKARRIAQSLVADRLAEWDGTTLRLPS